MGQHGSGVERVCEDLQGPRLHVAASGLVPGTALWLLVELLGLPAVAEAVAARQVWGLLKGASGPPGPYLARQRPPG